MEIVVAKVMMI